MKKKKKKKKRLNPPKGRKRKKIHSPECRMSIIGWFYDIESAVQYHTSRKHRQLKLNKNISVCVCGGGGGGRGGGGRGGGRGVEGGRERYRRNDFCLTFEKGSTLKGKTRKGQ